MTLWQEGALGVRCSGRTRRVKVSPDGRGVVSHAGTALLRELATETGLADAVTGIEVLRDRQSLFGAVASMPAAWRLLDRVDEAHLPRVRAARAVARQRAWQAEAAPDPAGELRIDFDATISIAHSEKQNAAATWKKTFDLSSLAGVPGPAGGGRRGGEGLAGLLRAGTPAATPQRIM